MLPPDNIRSLEAIPSELNNRLYIALISSELISIATSNKGIIKNILDNFLNCILPKLLKGDKKYNEYKLIASMRPILDPVK